MKTYRYGQGDPSQQVVILSKSIKAFTCLWSSKIFQHVVFYLCSSPEEAIQALDTNPDLFLSYDTVHNVKEVLSMLQQNKHTMKPCNAMCLYNKPVERKILIEAGGRDFLSIGEASADREKEDNLFILTVEKSLGMVLQQRYFQEVLDELVEMVGDNTNLVLPDYLKQSDFLTHLKLGIKALSQELLLREQKMQDSVQNLEHKELLTKRQTQVCQLIVVEGLTNKEVALKLSENSKKNISVRTIERHRDAINKKLGHGKLLWIRYLQENSII